MAEKETAKDAPKETPRTPPKTETAKPAKKGPSASRRYTAEFLGTFVLLFVGIGAAIFSSVNGGTSYDEGFIALAVGLSIGMSIYAWGNISGGHYNPAVTLGFVVAGRLDWEDAIPYWISQVLGGLTGMGLIYAIASGYSQSATAIPKATAMGATGYAASGSPYVFDAWAVVLFEIVATFLFVSVILFVTDKDGYKGFHGLAIGLTLSILVLAGINVDGLSVNPARSTASAVWASVAGINWPLDQLWAFWLAPLVGAAFAALIWRLLRNPEVDTLP